MSLCPPRQARVHEVRGKEGWWEALADLLWEWEACILAGAETQMVAQGTLRWVTLACFKMKPRVTYAYSAELVSKQFGKMRFDGKFQQTYHGRRLEPQLVTKPAASWGESLDKACLKGNPVINVPNPPHCLNKRGLIRGPGIHVLGQTCPGSRRLEPWLVTKPRR